MSDFVVLGSGAAGLTGALVAAIGGASVTVLEKAELVGGTTAISGGGAWLPNTRHLSDVGLEDTPEAALTYLRSMACGTGDDTHLVSLIEHAPEVVEFLEDQAGIPFQIWPAIGGCIDYRPWLPGAKLGGRTVEVLGISLSELGDWKDRIRVDPALRSSNNLLDYYSQMHHLFPMPAGPSEPLPECVDTYWRGTALAVRLLKACLDREVDVRTSTRAIELILEGGRVVGVKAEHDGQCHEFRAPHLLVATGGFTHNEELKRLWLTRPIDYTCDVETNEGDGHLMAMAAGAQMAGIGDAWWMPHTPLGRAGQPVNAGGTREDRILPHTLMVNEAGQRFMNEALNYYDAGEAFGRRSGPGPRNFPAWLVFDQEGVDRYGVLAYKVPPEDERPEWFHAADTIRDLARSINVEPDAMQLTIERFNGFARSGLDTDFGRGESEWDRAWGDPNNTPNPSLGTIDRSPFYAVPIYPGAVSTRGGLRVDDIGRVLSAKSGEPIPGLYGAGNCSNGSAAGGYAGPGATIGPAMTFGYLIGRTVADAVGRG